MSVICNMNFVKKSLLLVWVLFVICCTTQKQASMKSTEKPVAATFNDEALEHAISVVLKEKMMEKECETGFVYVVETSTGHIKANVSLRRKGRSFVPYEDTYAEEQSVMLGGPTYLALLSTGKCSPNDVVDTGNGIYKDLREHNWRSGGYGAITLEKALGNRSHVAFAMTKDVVYEGRQEEFDEKMDTYLAGDPNHAMGILTFYNAVANGGKMVRLMTEGDGVVVLNEQIAAPEHIETLKQGLRNAVSQGLCRQAKRDYTDVAACCRTFMVGKKTRRMEICGYFPADRPLYTIMVILEKNGLPVSAGVMCAPVMASTIDILTEVYDLRPTESKTGSPEPADIN